MPEGIQKGVELTVMAFDFGTRRIGVAVGNTLTCLGSPLKPSQNRLAMLHSEPLRGF